MNKLKLRSVRVKQWFLLASVVTLALLAIVNSYFSSQLHTAEERYLRILRLQKSFADTLTLENSVLDGTTHYASLLAATQNVVIEVELEDELLNHALLREREYLFGKLLRTTEETAEYYSGVRGSMAELVNSVRYIHEYHIANMKNILSRGKAVQNHDSNSEFTHRQGKRGRELDIIAAAVVIQSHLPDVISVFDEMQLGNNPSDVEKLSKQRMERFYELVKQFDDATYDARDGLLVEELLIHGERFTKAFNDLLKNNRLIELLNGSMKESQHNISAMFDDALSQLEKKNAQLRLQLNIVQTTSTVVTFMLALWLIYYGLKVVKAFTRTVSETRRIQDDLTYRIPVKKNEYLEFDIIYETLNTLADKAEQQVKSLEKMQRELSRRVQERTSELVHMNTRLKNEIEDRVKADDSRRELEVKLIRAKKMEAIGTLAGGVAHDLNNLLSGVVSYPELVMLDMKKDDPLYPTMQTIKQSGEKAAAIVQDLLTLARRGVAVEEVVDFRKLLEEYLGSPEFACLSKVHPEVEVVCDFQDNTCYIKGSRLHLLKSMMNLVTNGMEAMPEGGTLTLSSRSVYIDTSLKGYDTVKEGDYVMFAIEDTGIGMSMEVTERIFEPFFTRKQMGRSGTGLGMAVVYSTVKDHGGYIDIESTPGKGSLITLYLPLSREEEGDLLSPMDVSDIMGKSEHVLVVDDIYEQRQIATMMLKRLNYTVATAAGGDEAVRYVKDNCVDLVVLDMIMPQGMDGLDTFLALKAVMPEIRVVIASGFSESARVRKAQEMGAGRYIPKPYSLETLGSALKEVLKY